MDMMNEHTDKQPQYEIKVADQAALHGLLKKVRDLGMPLLSVQAIE
jgi:hypothetical protein